MLPGWIVVSGARHVMSQRQLRPEHRRHPEFPCRLGKSDDAVEAVVIGDGQCSQIQPLGLGDHLLRHRRAVEEAVGAVRMQFGVGY